MKLKGMDLLRMTTMKFDSAAPFWLFKFRFIAQFDLPLRRGAHCASDNHQELVVVKNISIFGEITSFSVVLVFMA